MTNDLASLDRLHDVILPDPVAWWPLAPAAYVVGWVLLLGLAWAAWCWWHRRQRNAYRRAALVELEILVPAVLDRTRREEAVTALAALVKRTALAAFPRRDVASLSGSAWLDFLDRTGGQSDFARGPGAVLATLSYHSDLSVELDESQLRALVGAVRNWVVGHRTDRKLRPLVKGVSTEGNT